MYGVDYSNKQWGMVSDTTDTTTYTINYNISFPKKSTMIIFPNSGKKQPVYYTGQWTSPGTNSFDVIFNTGCQYVFWFAIGY